MDTLLASVGFLIVGMIVWEVFRDLFHPGDSGALSDWLGRRLFNLLRRRRPLLPLAGPLTIVLVILVWVLALVLGFALVYYGSFPEEFRTSTGTIPPDDPRLLQVLYFSFETLITLGYGDLVPDSMAMRFLAASEALIGFGLLTASVSSIVLLYPALARMRLLARSVANMVHAERLTGLSVAVSHSEVLAELARQVTNTRIDLVHFPVLYYFASKEEDASVPHWTFHLLRFSREGLAADGPPTVRLAAGALDHAIADLAALFAERFTQMRADDREAVFRAVARDHVMRID